MSVTTRWKVNSLEELAQVFDDQAKSRRELSKHATLKRNQLRYGYEADSFEDAARITRSTTLESAS